MRQHSTAPRAIVVRLCLVALGILAALPGCGPVEGQHCSNAGAIRCMAATDTGPAKASICGTDNTWGDYVSCPGMDWTCKPCGTGSCTEPVGCQPVPCAAKCSADGSHASLCMLGGGKAQVACGTSTCSDSSHQGCGGPCGLPSAPACNDYGNQWVCTSEGTIAVKACPNGCQPGVGCLGGTSDAGSSDADATEGDTVGGDTSSSEVVGDAGPKECPKSVEGGICDDFSECTEDLCDTTTGTCKHTPSDALCNDGNACTQDACGASGNSFVCSHAPVNNPCSDNDLCTIQDACSQGKCVGAPKNCDDGNVCTTDGCVTDCTHNPVGVPCEADGSVCTSDLCEGGTCKAGTPVACDDKNPCTADACDPAKNCTFVPVAAGTACDDGLPCTQPDTCQNGSCSGTPIACSDGLECVAGTCQVVDHEWTSWKPPLTPQGLKPDPAGDTVYHPLTGRTWQRQASASKLNWPDAKKLCEDLVLAGKSDWRLPTAVELLSLLDVSKTSKEALIDLVAFPGTPAAAFWSGTQWSTSGMYVGLNFELGTGGPVDGTSTMYVRCVR